jgi:phage-related protein
LRTAIFHPAALSPIRGFPKVVKRDLGEALLKIQWGATIGMPLSRPMPDVAPGAQELRLRDSTGIYRRSIWSAPQTVPCSFSTLFRRKRKKTPQLAMKLAKRRLREMTP